MAKMKAAVFEGVGKITVEEIDIPLCSENGMLVKVEACGICGSDVRNLQVGLRDNVDKQIMGHEIAGIVVEVGKDVKRFKEGDRVAIAPDVSCGECYYCKRGFVNLCLKHRMLGTHWPGGFAQYIYINEEVLKKGIINVIPSTISFEEAVLAEPASSVIACQEYNNISLGDTVAIIGDGPMGCLHAEIARARGASRVILIGLKRLNAAKLFNPTYLIDVAVMDPVQKVYEITEGIGADFAIVAVPVPEAQQQALRMVRKRGKVILFGGLPKTSSVVEFDANLIHYNEISLVGAFSYPKIAHEKALASIAEGKIHAKKYVNKEVSLDNIMEGFSLAQEGKALKVVVKPWK